MSTTMAGESLAVQLLDNENHVSFNFLDDPPMLRGVDEQRHRSVHEGRWRQLADDILCDQTSTAAELFVASNFYHKRESFPHRTVRPFSIPSRRYYIDCGRNTRRH